MLEEDERAARALGADFFMRKPFDYDALLDRVSRVLAGLASSGAPASPHRARSEQEVTAPH